MIVAFSGKRGRGKTLSANYLVDNFGFIKVGFADLLKDNSKRLFPFTKDQMYGAEKEQPFGKYDWTPREFLLRFGQFMRYWDKDYWVKNVINQSKILPKIVIDDLRFKNEAVALKKVGATLIRLERYAKDLPYAPNIEIDKDISEVDLDEYKGFDYHIDRIQNLTKRALYDRICMLMSEINSK